MPKDIQLCRRLQQYGPKDPETKDIVAFVPATVASNKRKASAPRKRPSIQALRKEAAEADKEANRRDANRQAKMGLGRQGKGNISLEDAASRPGPSSAPAEPGSSSALPTEPEQEQEQQEQQEEDLQQYLDQIVPKGILPGDDVTPLARQANPAAPFNPPRPSQTATGKEKGKGKRKQAAVPKSKHGAGAGAGPKKKKKLMTKGQLEDESREALKKAGLMDESGSEREQPEQTEQPDAQQPVPAPVPDPVSVQLVVTEDGVRLVLQPPAVQQPGSDQVTTLLRCCQPARLLLHIYSVHQP